MKHRERVGISEYRIERAPTLLVTYGLGSCLGVAIYDSEQRLGGLAHTLLPSPRPGIEETRPGKFVATAIQAMVDDLVARGAARDRLTAKIAGGATMFQTLQNIPGEGIGIRNIRIARETLAGLEIPVPGEDVGGHHGRTLEFDLATGQVMVRSVRGSDTLVVL